MLLAALLQWHSRQPAPSRPRRPCPQNEAFEYELEELSGSVKKKQKPPPRVGELEELVASYTSHVSHLEKLLRCVDNDTIAADELEDIKAEMDEALVRPLAACQPLPLQATPKAGGYCSLSHWAVRRCFVVMVVSYQSASTPASPAVPLPRRTSTARVTTTTRTRAPRTWPPPRSCTAP